MTCVVGYVTPSREVWMGGDSAGVAGYDLRVRRDVKVFHAGPFLIGYTTSFRMGQLLRFNLPLDDLNDRIARLEDSDDAVFRFMATKFIDAVRTTLKNGGSAYKENEVEHGGNFLVGFKGRLFEVQGDYQVGIPSEPYSAVGCGADFALGALAVTDITCDGMGVQAAIRLALMTAEKFSAGVRQPFLLENQPSPTETRP